MPGEKVPVLDSSALTALILAETGFSGILDLMDRADDHDLVPATLDFAKVESANAVWKQCVLLKRLEPAAAARLVSGIEILRLDFRTFRPPLLGEAFRIAQKWRTTVYDAAFVALAAQLGGLLVTRDGRQAKIAEKYVKVALL